MLCCAGICGNTHLYSRKLLNGISSLIVVEKSQMAGVDSDNRHGGKVKFMYGFKEGAVAADTDQKICLVAVFWQ